MAMPSRVKTDDIRAGARFLRKLPSFLTRPLTLEQARRKLAERLENRATDFLALAKRAIYGHPPSLYRELLDLAGCEYGDMEQLVYREGLEEALHTLFRNGVYLTSDEFKGRRPAIRGSATIATDPGRLLNPATTPYSRVQTSGSRSEGITVPVDFGRIRDVSVNKGLALDARGGMQWAHATWGVPGGATLLRLLEFASFGAPMVRWFSHVAPDAPELHPRYLWSTRVLRWGGLLARVPFPSPEHAPVDNPQPILNWMTEVLETGNTPHVYTYPSSAVRLCRLALESGTDISGTEFSGGGEPCTEARQAVIREAGANSYPTYGSVDSGPNGAGCLRPEQSDDLHFFDDMKVFIQPGRQALALGVPPRAVFVSTLRETAPFVLVNVSLGDEAIMNQRQCGCPLENLGWKTHLHTIRSFEKLTAAGMTFLDTDIIRVMEKVLPGRFGGAPTDYQLVESEGPKGKPLLTLLVHPALGPLDENSVAESFLKSISESSESAQVMGRLWRDATLLEVERRVPYVTASGKILHLHSKRQREEAPT